MSESYNQEIADMIVELCPASQLIAIKSAVRLYRSGEIVFMLIEDDDFAKFWGPHYRNAVETIEKDKKLSYEYDVKTRVYNRLSVADRKVLKLKEPVKPKRYKPSEAACVSL